MLHLQFGGCLIDYCNTTYFPPLSKDPDRGAVQPPTVTVSVRFGENTAPVREDSFLQITKHLHTNDCPHLPPSPTGNTAVGPVTHSPSAEGVYLLTCMSKREHKIKRFRGFGPWQYQSASFWSTQYIFRSSQSTYSSGQVFWLHISSIPSGLDSESHMASRVSDWSQLLIQTGVEVLLPGQKVNKGFTKFKP